MSLFRSSTGLCRKNLKKSMKMYDPDLVDLLDDELRTQIEAQIEGQPPEPHAFSLRWRLFWENLDLLQGQWTRTLCGLFYLYISLILFGRSRPVFNIIIILFFSPQMPIYNPVLIDMKCLFMYDEAVEVLTFLNRGIIAYLYAIRYV